MKFTLEIKLGNAAMQTGEDVAEALEETARKIRDTYGIDYVDEWAGLGAFIRDANGNRVGRWSIEAEDES